MSQPEFGPKFMYVCATEVEKRFRKGSMQYNIANNLVTAIGLTGDSVPLTDLLRHRGYSIQRIQTALNIVKQNLPARFDWVRELIDEMYLAYYNSQIQLLKSNIAGVLEKFDSFFEQTNLSLTYDKGMIHVNTREIERRKGVIQQRKIEGSQNKLMQRSTAGILAAVGVELSQTALNVSEVKFIEGSK